MLKEAAVERCLRRHPDWNNRRIAKSITGVSYDLINQHRVRLGLKPQPSAPRGPSTTLKNGRHVLSRSQFTAQYDRDTRLRLAIEKGVATLTNLDEIINDATFRVERCGNPPSAGWRQIAEEAQFKQYQFQAGGQTHWAHPDTKEWAITHVQGAHEI